MGGIFAGIPLFEDIDPLIEAGCALHLLHPRTKRPIGDDWSTKPVWTAAQLRAQVLQFEREFGSPLNLGIRLGEPSRISGLYLHVFDVDVRDPDREADAFA